MCSPPPAIAPTDEGVPLPGVSSIVLSVDECSSSASSCATDFLKRISRSESPSRRAASKARSTPS